MKNKLSLAIIVLGIFAISTTHALAVKRAVFPDSKSLQPIPTNIYPNISGNVNSTVNIKPATYNQDANQVAPINNIQKTVRQTNTYTSMIWWLIIPAIIIIFIFTYIKLKKKNELI